MYSNNDIALSENCVEVERKYLKLHGGVLEFF